MVFFFFKQKTAYEVRISDWSSDVCSSDLKARDRERDAVAVLAVLHDIERGIAFRDVTARLGLEQVEQAVEADRRTPIGRKVEIGSHLQILLNEAIWA